MMPTAQCMMRPAIASRAPRKTLYMDCHDCRGSATPSACLRWGECWAARALESECQRCRLSACLSASLRLFKRAGGQQGGASPSRASPANRHFRTRCMAGGSFPGTPHLGPQVYCPNAASFAPLPLAVQLQSRLLRRHRPSAPGIRREWLPRLLLPLALLLPPPAAPNARLLLVGWAPTDARGCSSKAACRFRLETFACTCMQRCTAQRMLPPCTARHHA